MKVVCIYNKRYYEYLTIDKIYNVIRINKDGDYKIIDDYYEEWWYPEEYFKPLSEIRNDKINKLLR